MSVDLILFFGLALVAIAAAIGMLTSQNAVYSALFLVINFATVAVFYLLLGAPFIAMAQITVYAGAIMVLFLFVIMLLGAEKLAPGKVLPYQRPMAIGLAVLLVVEAVYLILARNPSVATIIPPTEATNTVEAVPATVRSHLHFVVGLHGRRNRVDKTRKERRAGIAWYLRLITSLYLRSCSLSVPWAC